MKKAASILLVLILLMTLSVPGITSAEEAATEPAGAYKLTAVTGEEDDNLEIISKVSSFGVNLYLFLQEDGTGSIRILDTEIPLTWKDGILVIPPAGKSEETIRLPFTCADGGLKIQTSAFAMSFASLSDAEQKEYEENGAGSLLGVAGILAMQLLDKLDGDLITSLLFSLAGGSIFDVEIEPIPDGEPSEGPVTGMISGMEYTVLGAEHAVDEMAGDIIVFYYEVKNLTDWMDGAWRQDRHAGQGGEFLDEAYGLEGVPELTYTGLEICPGKTLRCAAAYKYDPEGGTVSFRICDYGKEGDVLYYADPQNLTGAPAEDFVFESDVSIPEEWKTLPEGTENLSLESAELITDEEGVSVKFAYRDLSSTDEVYPYYYFLAVQDGVTLERDWSVEDESNEEESYFVRLCKIRTGSPVFLVGFRAEGGSNNVPIAIKLLEGN